MIESNVFYVPGQTVIVDYARQLPNGAWVCQNAGLTLPQLFMYHPGVVLGGLDTFLADQDRALATVPTEITQARFESALLNRRTIDYSADLLGDSFKLDEASDGNMASIYARWEGRCWTFQGLATLPHQLIMQRVAQARHDLRSTR